MTGPGDGVGVVVVAVGEVGAMVEEELDPAFAELVAITLEVISAELVDHDDDYQLGTGVVGGGKTECGQ
jgi:hypothetical protein